MQELHCHAQGQLSTCKALKELEYWGSKSNFNLSSSEDFTALHSADHLGMELHYTEGVYELV